MDFPFAQIPSLSTIFSKNFLGPQFLQFYCNFSIYETRLTYFVIFLFHIIGMLSLFCCAIQALIYMSYSVVFSFQQSFFDDHRRLSQLSDQSIPEPTRAHNGNRITEDPLITAIKNGSQSAFSEFVHTYRQRVFSVIYNIINNSSDAADIAQDVFIKAFNSIHSFRSNSSLFTWLYRIAVNMALSFLRKNKKCTVVSLDYLDESGITPETLQFIPVVDGCDRSVALKELQKKLNEALQKLSNSHRVVFVLFEIEGLSHEQIASIVGCSIGTVRSRLHYAKQQLQGFLKEYM
ncbi:MAG: sigma-70 family RNA polymerase sigma factor [Puniceicoccales bacterium]|jgi:RNA polymerase sigma-70 factor (ECF subfamily)|nr:sigma-70 family RNA polymerase sigma factor [Puniceicoccales bacterium]